MYVCMHSPYALFNHHFPLRQPPLPPFLLRSQEFQISIADTSEQETASGGHNDICCILLKKRSLHSCRRMTQDSVWPPIDDFGPVLACKNVLNVTTTSRCDNRSLPSFPSSRAEILLISIASRHGHTKAGGSLWRPYRDLCHPPEEAATTSEGGRRRDVYSHSPQQRHFSPICM